LERTTTRGRETLRRDLFLISSDGAAYSVMVGVGETYVPAFALAAGLGAQVAGLVAVVPMLAGALLGMASPWAIRRLGSNRSWVVLCAVVQALAFVPLVGAAWAGSISTWLLFGVATLYWGAGLATGPAWNTWAGTLVPAEMRARFFGRRVRVVQLSVLAGLVAGGWILHEGSGSPVRSFTALFVIALVCRLVSARLLASTSEPVPLPPEGRGVGLGELLRRFRTAHDGRFILYLMVVQVAVQISAPFFTPYMLEELELGYVGYMALTATPYLVKVAASPALGEVAHRFGPRRLLWIGGVGLIPLPAMWVVSAALPWLFFSQVVSGLAWACYELATILLVFDSIRPEERTSILTTHNLANSLAMSTGVVLGSLVLGALGLGPRAYLAVFLVSSAARALTLFALRHANAPEPGAFEAPIPTRVLALRPSMGSFERPILPGLEAPASSEPVDDPGAARPTG